MNLKMKTETDSIFKFSNADATDRHRDINRPDLQIIN